VTGGWPLAEPHTFKFTYGDHTVPCITRKKWFNVNNDFNLVQHNFNTIHTEHFYISFSLSAFAEAETAAAAAVN
jgi:hypothetical protein